VREINPAFTRITGLGAEDVEGLSLYNLFVWEDAGLGFEALREAVDADGHWQGELPVRDREGHQRVCLVSISAVAAPSGLARTMWRFCPTFPT